MNSAAIAQCAAELFRALTAGRPVPPLTEREPGMTSDDAYRISYRVLRMRLARGERIVGKKVGVTSDVVQRMLGVYEPDFGYLTDAMQYPNGGRIPIGRALICPLAEGEIAFYLGRDLVGPGITESHVLAATEWVAPCLEIVDSRIRDWKIRSCDTIADNASSGLFVVGSKKTDPRAIHLEDCQMTLSKNGAVVSAGTGAQSLGSPLRAVAWLANAFGRLGARLAAGEIILSGSLVPLEPIQPHDRITVDVEGMGRVSARFT